MRPDEADRAGFGDIAEYGCRLARHLDGGDLDRFLADECMQDAVVRCLLVIGEAARRMSDATRELHPVLPWAQMIAMRNLLVHDYGTIDMREVWVTATRDVPHLVEQAQTALGSD
ncbi:MAG: nucleotidyltransferase [Coriobacteriaceae bacterium]|nr:nucleotidyltransferase [Coriobacteriaceae bacterium]